jgi:hypothetical protein
LAQEREIFYRLRDHANSEDSPPGEFVLFVGAPRDLHEIVSEFRDRQPMRPSDVRVVASPEPEFAHELTPYSEIVARIDSLGPAPRTSVLTWQTKVGSGNAFLEKMRGCENWLRLAIGTASNSIGAPIKAEPRRALLLAAAGVIIFGAASAVSMLVFRGRLARPSETLSIMTDPGQERMQPGLDSTSDSGAASTASLPESQLSVSETSEQPSEKRPEQENNASEAHTLGGTNALPSEIRPFETTAFSSEIQPFAKSTPPLNQSLPQEAQNESFGHDAEPAIENSSSAPIPAARPRSLRPSIAIASDSVSRDSELEAIRTRILRERMKQWWKQANLERQEGEEPEVARARAVRSKKAKARIRSEIAALPEAELLRVEAMWKNEERSHRSKQKTQPIQNPSSAIFGN